MVEREENVRRPSGALPPVAVRATTVRIAAYLRLNCASLATSIYGAHVHFNRAARVDLERRGRIQGVGQENQGGVLLKTAPCSTRSMVGMRTSPETFQQQPTHPVATLLRRLQARVGRSGRRLLILADVWVAGLALVTWFVASILDLFGFLTGGTGYSLYVVATGYTAIAVATTLALGGRRRMIVLAGALGLAMILIGGAQVASRIIAGLVDPYGIDAHRTVAELPWLLFLAVLPGLLLLIGGIRWHRALEASSPGRPDQHGPESLIRRYRTAAGIAIVLVTASLVWSISAGSLAFVSPRYAYSVHVPYGFEEGDGTYQGLFGGVKVRLPAGDWYDGYESRRRLHQFWVRELPLATGVSLDSFDSSEVSRASGDGYGDPLTSESTTLNGAAAIRRTYLLTAAPLEGFGLFSTDPRFNLQYEGPNVHVVTVVAVHGARGYALTLFSAPGWGSQDDRLFETFLSTFRFASAA
jgi:hypothetical protein